MWLSSRNNAAVVDGAGVGDAAARVDDDPAAGKVGDLAVVVDGGTTTGNVVGIVGIGNCNGAIIINGAVISELAATWIEVDVGADIVDDMTTICVGDGAAVIGVGYSAVVNDGGAARVVYGAVVGDGAFVNQYNTRVNCQSYFRINCEI